MALKNDFFVNCVDFCNKRIRLYEDYRGIALADYDLKKEAKAKSAFDKLEMRKVPMTLALMTEDEARGEFVDKAVAKFAKKLRMKYRVIREDIKRKKAKALKENESADLTELDSNLEQALKNYEDAVAERKARLEKEFDELWTNRNVDVEAVKADLQKLEEENEAIYAKEVEKLDQAFAKKKARYEKVTDTRVKFWHKVSDLVLKIGEEKAEETAQESPAVEDVETAEIAEETKKIKSKKKVKKVIEPLPDDIILRATDLSMHFGGLKAVDELDFEVKRNEVFGLIGPNGAGKTTVFNCITQFYKPTKGELHFVTKEGKTVSLTDYKVHDVILKGIARTFQNVEVVKEVSVLDNMLIAATRQYSSTLFEQMLHLPILKREERLIRAKADKILAYMGLSIYRDRLAWGLPYGVLKRIEIARVLMCDPQLIILDEPAAGLNDTETRELADLIRKIRDDFDCTVLLVEHDMGRVMDVCDHICAISFGRKLAYGTPQEVQASKEVQEAYLGTGGNN